MFTGDEGLPKKKKIPQLIPSQSRYLIETDNLICAANQFDRFLYDGNTEPK